MSISKEADRIISQHIFMFPFYLNEDNIDGALAHLPEWEERPFDPGESGLNYSEFSYFHPYVRRVLYNNYDRSKNAKSVTCGPAGEAGTSPWISRYFERTAAYNSGSRLIIKIQGQELPYELDVDSISLRVFESKVGILSFSLFNNKYNTFSDIQLINDLGRRVYPQFLPNCGGIEKVKESLLAESITLEIKGRGAIIEPFTQGPGSAVEKNNDRYSIRVGEHIRKMLDGLHFTPILDDRMFTVCWVGDNLLYKDITNDDYLSSGLWYRFIFLDERWPGLFGQPEAILKW